MSMREYGRASDRPHTINDAVDQLMRGGWNLPSLLRQQSDEGQLVPVNVFENQQDLVIVAPMPGMEPENIEVSVTGNTLTIRGDLRGPGQFDRKYLRHEWTYGPYHRTIELPFPVDTDQANASFNNGMLTVSLPKSARFRSRRIELRHLGPTRGQATGHSGHQTRNVQ